MAKGTPMRTIDTEKLVEAISERWHAENPGWNTGPARREIAALALDALPSHTMKLEDGTWVPAVGQYTFDKTMETLSRVEKERAALEVEVMELRRKVG